MTNKKKILILIDWYLPGTKAGGPVRSVHALVMHLRNEFDFYILTTNTDLGESIPYENVQTNVWLEQDGYRVKYLSNDNVNATVIAAEMQNAGYDHIYINSLYSKWFSVVPLKIARKSNLIPKIILAPRGMLGKGAMAIKPLKKRIFIFIARTFGWFKGITWHATGEHEKNDILSKIARNANVQIAPNLSWVKVQENVIKKKEPGKLNLFFLSRIAKVKNLHLALKMLKDIPPAHIITYDIYGPLEDADYWEECQQIISALPQHIQVNYNGTLEHDNLPQVLANYHALFMPTSNENFGHSIIESMACGCPVLISDQTPWRNLETKKAGFDLSLSNADKFLEVIIKWSSFDQTEWNSWNQGACSFAKKFLENTADKNKYTELFK